jgi:uncharacterized protein (TIGR00369 family)
MVSLNPEHVKAVIKVINQGPYIRYLSMPVKEMGKGYAIVEAKIGNEHMHPFGRIHGGAYASILDTAAYWAVYCEVDEDAGFTSIDLKIDFLAPFDYGIITAKGKSIKIGKTMCLAEATAVDENGKWLAHGTSKMIVTKGIQTIEDALKFSGTEALPPKFI